MVIGFFLPLGGIVNSGTTMLASHALMFGLSNWTRAREKECFEACEGADYEPEHRLAFRRRDCGGIRRITNWKRRRQPAVQIGSQPPVYTCFAGRQSLFAFCRWKRGPGSPRTRQFLGPSPPLVFLFLFNNPPTKTQTHISHYY